MCIRDRSWTCARDIGKAVVELCKAEHWVSDTCVNGSGTIEASERGPADSGQEEVTYVSAEWGTFNTAITTMEAFYGMLDSVTYACALANSGSQHEADHNFRQDYPYRVRGSLGKIFNASLKSMRRAQSFQTRWCLHRSRR